MDVKKKFRLVAIKTYILAQRIIFCCSLNQAYCKRSLIHNSHTEISRQSAIIQMNALGATKFKTWQTRNSKCNQIHRNGSQIDDHTNSNKFFGLSTFFSIVLVFVIEFDWSFGKVFVDFTCSFSLVTITCCWLTSNYFSK